MSTAVRLKDLAAALEMLDEVGTSYLDLDSGQVETVSREILSRAEEFAAGDEEPKLPAWQKPEWELANRIVSSARFLELPGQDDLNEWQIMSDFSGSIRSEKISAELQDALPRRCPETNRRRLVP